MAIALVWMNSHEAKIFHIDSDKIHAEGIKVNEAGSDLQEMHFFKKLSDKLNLQHPEKILLMGPGVSLHHFEKYLASHHHNLQSKIIGIEKVDHMPDSEILAAGRKFLHKYFLYQGVIN